MFDRIYKILIMFCLGCFIFSCTTSSKEEASDEDSYMHEKEIKTPKSLKKKKAHSKKLNKKDPSFMKNKNKKGKNKPPQGKSPMKDDQGFPPPPPGEGGGDFMLNKESDEEQDSSTKLSESLYQGKPSNISWVSFDYNIKESKTSIEIISDADLTYEVYSKEESTQIPSYTMIFTFINSKIQPNLLHTINTSAFASSISSIKLKQDKKDVLMYVSLRDNISFKEERVANNLKLNFPILVKYKEEARSLRNYKQKIYDRAESLNDNLTGFSDSVLGSESDIIEVKEIFISQVAQASDQDIKDSSKLDPQSQSDIQEPASSMSEVHPSTPAPLPDNYSSVDRSNDIIGDDLGSKDYTKYIGESVEIEFYSTPLRQVLQTFADQSGSNFIFSKDVGEELISIKLSRVPWDAALEAILETYKLVMSRIGKNIVRIDRMDKMMEYLDAKEKISTARLLSEKKKILVMKLSNANASDVKERFEEILMNEGLKSKIKVSVDNRTNTLLLEAPEAILSKARVLVSRLDTPIPQVEIASKIIEVNKTLANFLGISWGGSMLFDQSNGLDFGSLNFPNNVRIPSFQIDPGVSSYAEGTTGAMDFLIGSLNDVVNLDLKLRLQENNGTTEILQSNKILVKDREKAVIETGNSDYFAVTTGEGTDAKVSLESVNYTLRLQVTPELTKDGRVNLDLNLQSNSPGSSANTKIVAAVNRRELNTKLIKRSGETAVIGGIYDNKKMKQEWKVPILSSIPLLGALFRGNQQKENHVELMVLITPTIKTADGASIIGEKWVPKVALSDKDDVSYIETKEDNEKVQEPVVAKKEGQQEVSKAKDEPVEKADDLSKQDTNEKGNNDNIKQKEGNSSSNENVPSSNSDDVDDQEKMLSTTGSEVENLETILEEDIPVEESVPENQ